MDAYLWLFIILMVASGVVLWVGYLGFAKHEEEEHGRYHNQQSHGHKH